MSAPSLKQSLIQKYLDPADSLAEIFFGIIMVLTFTLGAGIATETTPVNTQAMLIAIVGCNIAWGVIDGVMYIMGSWFERAHQVRMVRRLRQVHSASDAVNAIGRQLDPLLASLYTEAERTDLYQRIFHKVQSEPPPRTRLEAADVYGAIASFWLVLVSTIPAILPFLWITDFAIALRVSNLLSLALLFIVGYTWAQYTNTNRWLAGLALLLLGLALVLVAIALGG